MFTLAEHVFVRPGPVDSLSVVDPAAQSDSVGPLAAFHYKEFSLFFGAGLLSNTGTWMQTVTVPYVIDQLTHSTALVGVSAFAAFFPATLVGPLAGSLADRYDRRTVLIWAQVVMMTMAAALWATWATGVADTPIILGCVVISGLGAGITTAAWQSFVPQLVPRPVLLSAVRLNSMQFTGARAFGPALAGLVLATLGPSAAFGFNALSFLAVIGALLMIVKRPPINTGKGVKVLAHFREGIRYARQRPSLYVSVLMVILIALFGVAIVQLIEPISRHVFHVGAGEYGLMSAAYGLGAVIGGVFTVAYGDTFRRSRLAFIGLTVMAAGDLLLGVAPHVHVGAGGAPRYGAGAGAVHGVVQHRDPGERRRELPRARLVAVHDVVLRGRADRRARRRHPGWLAGSAGHGRGVGRGLGDLHHRLDDPVRAPPDARRGGHRPRRVRPAAQAVRPAADRPRHRGASGGGTGRVVTVSKTLTQSLPKSG